MNKLDELLAAREKLTATCERMYDGIADCQKNFKLLRATKDQIDPKLYDMTCRLGMLARRELLVVASRSEVLLTLTEKLIKSLEKQESEIDVTPAISELLDKIKGMPDQ